ncbi:hypothetical protein GY45DRAFT_1364938 [Cubamyces sp. BRFM 1775]|nr:hypothetical protein GY45DRAFT_1364938 [Cubamyces sp. BRFM 1775]
MALDQVSDALLPRRYQEEIFTRAQQGNVIAALDTGSGKTFISTLLIKWVAARNIGGDKITVFLVPKVALVQQQGEFISKQTTLRVRQFSGATAHDMGDREGWKKEFEDADVFVMTAQIFLNLLTHSHWSMDKVSLIVFDECHHTRKNHAYNGIMREYFQTPVESRPKVFGMTASPIWNPKNAVESLTTLERNLDSKVIAVKEHVDELVGHSPKPTEIIHVYPASPEKYPDYESKSLKQRLDLEHLPPKIGIPVEKILTRYAVTLYSLGPFGAELFLYTEVKQRVSQLIQDALDSAMDYLTPAQYTENARGRFTALHQEDLVHPRLRELEQTLAEFSSFFDPPEGSTPPEIPMSWCSPKVRVLAETLFHSHVIKAEQLVGHGRDAGAKTNTKGMGTRNQQDTVQLFRERRINVLSRLGAHTHVISVASVLETTHQQHMATHQLAITIPCEMIWACDLVIRFDPVQHMVGYVQSRGRARHKTSTFIIMVQEGAQAQAERYLQFLQSEPQLKQVYQERDLALSTPDEDEDDKDDPADLAERERFVVPTTGAILSYTSAIGLLNNLCSLIPRDKFTPMHVPRYTGDYSATVHLPSSLPLPADLLVYEGPPRRSKKEAKRAAAFLAVKKLHSLNVFDDYLLPAKSSRGREKEDPDGVPIGDVSKIPDVMEVRVRDPWVLGRTLWLHVVYLDGRPSAGLVTGTPLLPVDLVASGLYISTDEPRELVLHPLDAWSQRRAMEDYTRMGLWWCITGRGITLPLTCYLVPITRDYTIDFAAIEQAILHPYGSYNWDGVEEEHYGHLLYMNNKEAGHPMILHRFRDDITPSSQPPPGSREEAFPTYRDFWLHKTFFILPELCHRATDVWRAREARIALKLPPIADDVLVQALTLPSANTSFNNQRLETLGDAVLKLAAVVHLFNKYPHRHEGQLDSMKRVSVSNRTLLARAVERRLERHLSSENQSIRMWRYITADEDDLYALRARRRTARQFPRKSMQDCMEAILGASFATGGIDMALRAGDALGIAIGGPSPWSMRYRPHAPKSPPAPLFAQLQETLGYDFVNGQLLLEAITHPSFSSTDSTSYQRLEFLGDALIDLVVTDYLYKKYPKATSGQLSWARSRTVCAPALAVLAVKRLRLHQYLLINNVELSIAIARYVPILEEISDEEIIHHGWKQDPPKALSDVFESVMGALLIDCDYNYDKAAAIVEIVMEDFLALLHPDMPRDPVSQLMVWVAQSGCRCVRFAKSQSRPELRRYDCMSVLVHETTVAGPIAAPNLSMAKGLAAEEARRVLDDPSSPHHLSRVCVCGMEQVKEDEPVELPPEVVKEELDDETHEGFAILAQILIEETEDPELKTADEDEIAEREQTDGEDEDVGIPMDTNDTVDAVEENEDIGLKNSNGFTYDEHVQTESEDDDVGMAMATHDTIEELEVEQLMQLDV